MVSCASARPPPFCFFPEWDLAEHFHLPTLLLTLSSCWKGPVPLLRLLLFWAYLKHLVLHPTPGDFLPKVFSFPYLCCTPRLLLYVGVSFVVPSGCCGGGLCQTGPAASLREPGGGKCL